MSQNGWTTCIVPKKGNRSSRGDCAGDHLHELIRCDTVAQAGVEKVGEGSDESTEDKCDDVGPPRESGLALEDNDQTWTEINTDRPTGDARARHTGQERED